MGAASWLMRAAFLILLCAGCVSYQPQQSAVLSTNSVIDIAVAKEALWSSLPKAGPLRDEWLDNACVARQFIVEYETARTPDSALNIEAAVATAQLIGRPAAKPSPKRLHFKR